MGVTLNKDGTPRKVGSGKTKGAGCYENISLRDLRKLVNENAEVSVSRVWLRNAQAEKKHALFNLTCNLQRLSRNTLNRFQPLHLSKKSKNLSKKKFQPKFPKRFYLMMPMITSHPLFLLLTQGFVITKAKV